MGICYIVGAGDFFMNSTPAEDDLVIAADGGADALVAHGIRIDLLIGDMDSVSELPTGVERLVYPKDKDYTDTFLAYLEGVKRGYTEFLIFGGYGGREDHTCANYALLHYARLAGHRARLVGQRNTAFVLHNEKAKVAGMAGQHISAFAIGGAAKGVSIKGFYYEAEDITLTPEFPLAVSNIFLDTDGEIEVLDGTLLVITEN
ncbi:MAG: thiamine diphosphokinase [Clostridia bacterium]|nr:thiamine diphosphokinase [Clostridia bacterium]